MAKKNTRTVRLVGVFISAIIIIALFALFSYLLLPPWNIHSSLFWWFFVGMSLFAFIVNIIVGFNCCLFLGEWLNLWRLHTFKEKFARLFKFYPIAVSATIFVVIWLLLFCITAIFGSKMCNAEPYSNLLHVEDGNFSEDIISASSSDIVSVDVKTAQRLGDRTIGNIPNASWYEVDDEYNLVSINGEEYRISPLKYSGFFSSRKAGNLPGYVLVNAKTQNAQYVQLNTPMVYSPDAFFSKNLSRHLHKQYPSYVFSKSFFEVDDDGNPFWITAVRTFHIGLRGGVLENSAVVTNAVTGESVEYAISDLPEWVDHVHSVDYLMDLLKDHYGLQNGYFNFSKTKKYRTAYDYRDSVKEDENNGQNNEFTPFEGYNSVLTSNGEIMFYTGITPANKAETIIGFVLISPRTGEAKFYEVSGSEESSAQAAAEGLVQNLRYSASFPTIINVDGVETYFMTLKDGAGLVQKYALCNVEQYSIVVEADTISEAISKYKSRLGMPDVGSGDLPTGEGKEVKQISGTVSQVETAQIGGYTYYYFTLDSDEVIFMSSIENSNKQPLMLVIGATVNVKYYISEDPSIAIVTEIEF